jgi:hypothetical protein
LNRLQLIAFNLRYPSELISQTNLHSRKYTEYDLIEYGLIHHIEAVFVPTVNLETKTRKSYHAIYHRSTAADITANHQARSETIHYHQKVNQPVSSPLVITKPRVVLISDPHQHILDLQARALAGLRSPFAKQRLPTVFKMRPNHSPIVESTLSRRLGQ